jgi:hypothetical protein
MRLDWSMPYSEVWGMGRVVYEQAGRKFRPDGREIDAPDDAVEEVESEASPGASDDFQKMHWRSLKALVESFGGDWVNKEHAIAFLKGH